MQRRVLKGHAAHTKDRVYQEGEILEGSETELKPYFAQTEELTEDVATTQTTEGQTTEEHKKGGKR